mmetsp:Transcript_42348/g.105719  ORF Transcript_42348/g.105719 Transcript_42348/m.105719 type:complete len:182 (-) Transcript_42348:622-1167(-)
MDGPHCVHKRPTTGSRRKGSDCSSTSLTLLAHQMYVTAHPQCECLCIVSWCVHEMGRISRHTHSGEHPFAVRPSSQPDTKQVPPHTAENVHPSIRVSTKQVPRNEGVLSCNRLTDDPLRATRYRDATVLPPGSPPATGPACLLDDKFVPSPQHTTGGKQLPDGITNGFARPHKQRQAPQAP